MIGMQLPEKYKENFDVSSEGPTSGVWPVTPDQGPLLETSKFSLYFQVVASLATKACSYYCHYLHWHRQFKIRFCGFLMDVNE
jgi:hypothetical protein